MKVSPAFSKAAESRGRASGRAPQSAELSCAHKSAGGGPRGNPRRGFPLFFTLLRVRRFIGRWSMAPAAFRPHFFGACPKKRCRAAKEKRFFYPGGSTIRVSAPASVVFTHLRPTWGGGRVRVGDGWGKMDIKYRLLTYGSGCYILSLHCVRLIQRRRTG